jgi:hypothetical protein
MIRGYHGWGAREGGKDSVARYSISFRLGTTQFAEQFVLLLLMHIHLIVSDPSVFIIIIRRRRRRWSIAPLRKIRRMHVLCAVYSYEDGKLYKYVVGLYIIDQVIAGSRWNEQQHWPFRHTGSITFSYSFANHIFISIFPVV